MGLPNLGSAAAPKGIADAKMDNFRLFLNTVVYPPNPEQPIDRRFSGNFGDPLLEDGNGAQRGLKLFHTHPIRNEICAGRSCVGCHALPEGSGNRIAQFPLLQPQDTPGLRGLLHKEARLEFDARAHIAPTIVSEFGLTSTGEVQFSTNRFVSAAFFRQFDPQLDKLSDLIAFCRGRGTRALPARLDPAAAEGARERHLPVRQPHADAARLRRGRGVRAKRVLVRAAAAWSSRPRLPARRGAGGGQDLAAPGARPLRRAGRRGGRSDVPATWARRADDRRPDDRSSASPWPASGRASRRARRAGAGPGGARAPLVGPGAAAPCGRPRARRPARAHARARANRGLAATVLGVAGGRARRPRAAASMDLDRMVGRSSSTSGRSS